MKAHLKRTVVPTSWKIKRKGLTFVVRALPRGKFNFGVPLVVLFRDLLKKAKTSKEVKSILNSKEILIDGRRRKESKFLAGLMDTVSIPSTAEQFRILIDKKGRLTVVPIVKEEAGVKLCKIVKKGMVKGKVQIGLHDGRSIIVEKDGYKTGDSLLITVPDQTIKEHLKLEKGVLVYLIGGKYIGNIGTIDKLEKGGIIAKIGAENVEVKKEYIFVVGKGKAAISLK